MPFEAPNGYSSTSGPPRRWSLVGRARCEAVAVRVGDGLAAVAGAGLAVQVVDVALDGRLGDGQSFGDFGVREPLGDQREDRGLAGCEAVGKVRFVGRCPLERGGAGDRFDKVVLDGRVDRRFSPLGRFERGGDLGAGGVLGEKAAGAGSERLDDTPAAQQRSSATAARSAARRCREPRSAAAVRHAARDRASIPGLHPAIRSVRSWPTRPVHRARRTLSGSDPD
jgi:hypothetical protein